MNKAIYTAFIFLFIVTTVNAQTLDNKATMENNKKRIQEMLQRVDHIENPENYTNILESLEKIKQTEKRLRDSIVVLNQTIAALRAGGYTNAMGVASECVRLYYKFDKTWLDFNSNRSLDSILNVFAASTGKKIKLVGHADKPGDENYNVLLSKKRAESLKQYLVKTKKISNENILVEWHGSSAPLQAPPKQSMNRRVEVSLF